MAIDYIEKDDGWKLIYGGDDHFNTEFDRFFEISQQKDDDCCIIQYVELNHGRNVFEVIDAYRFESINTEPMLMSGYAWLIGDEGQCRHRDFLQSYAKRTDFKLYEVF